MTFRNPPTLPPSFTLYAYKRAPEIIVLARVKIFSYRDFDLLVFPDIVAIFTIFFYSPRNLFR